MDQEVIEQADLRQGAWLETVCAFANGHGGSLLVEVAETRRRKTPLETLEWLPVRIYEELGITCDVNLVMVGGRMGVEVAVLPSPQPVSYEGRFFQRRGGQTALLVGADLVRFLRGRDEEEEIPWERRPASAARLEDLDADALRILRRGAADAEELARRGASDGAPLAQRGAGDEEPLTLNGAAAAEALARGGAADAEALARGGAGARGEGQVGEAATAEETLFQLSALGLADAATGFLNHAGVLLAHRAPDELIEGAFVVVGFFADDASGASNRGPARRLEVRGPLTSQADQVVDAVLSPLPSGVRRVTAGRPDDAGGGRMKAGALPAVALREAVLNALAHKDYAAGAPVQVSVYADRVVVANVGRPPQAWTAEDLAAPHSARPANPAIASALAAVGAAGGWGRGMQLMADACARAGLPAPAFELGADETAVTLPLVPAPADPLADLRVSRVDRQVLALLADLDRPTASELASALAVSDSTVRRSLKRLTQLGLIARHGSTKTGFWHVLPR